MTTTRPPTDPRTLAELAASVATTDPIVRAYYLLRNAGAFGFDLGAALAHLTATAGLVCHRPYRLISLNPPLSSAHPAGPARGSRFSRRSRRAETNSGTAANSGRASQLGSCVPR